jgi:hypothetical protein
MRDKRPLVATAVSTFLAYMIHIGKYRSLAAVFSIACFGLSWYFAELGRRRTGDAFFWAGLVLAGAGAL